jgi:hypothetical protein
MLLQSHLLINRRHSRKLCSKLIQNKSQSKRKNDTKSSEAGNERSVTAGFVDDDDEAERIVAA